MKNKNISVGMKKFWEDKPKEYIDEVRDLNGKYKDSYQNDPNWTYKDKNTARNDINAKMAGGLSEEIRSERDLSGVNMITDR